ncbi:MAG: DUF4097 family beta strand repeat-containing protein [Candidatus Coproplasma sp.]
MKRMAKWIIAGIVIIIIGVAVLLLGLAANGWHWTAEFEERTFTSEGEITAMDIAASVGKVRVEYTDGENAEIIYPASQSFGYSVRQTGGTIILSFEKKWYSAFSFGWDIPETVVKIPRGIVPSAKFSVSAGTLTLTDCEFSDFEAEVSAGTFSAGKITCENANCKISAGSLVIGGFDCKALNVKVSAGSAKISRTICPDVKVNVSAGSAAVILAGKQNDYNVTADVSAGSCNLSSQYYEGAVKTIYANVSAGSAAITFAD